MTGKLLVLTPFLFMLTSCQQEQLSLPVTHAASTQEAHSEIQRPRVEPVDQPPPIKNCYAYILLRPRDQRAMAVQARLKKADVMSGSLWFAHGHSRPARRPRQYPVPAVPCRMAGPAVLPDRIRSVVEDYFSTPDVEDYMCNRGLPKSGGRPGHERPARSSHLDGARHQRGLVKDAPDEEASVR